MRGIDWQSVVEALAEGLAAESGALELDRAVVGLDGRREVELHVSIEECLRRAGYGVARERRFPSDRERKRSVGRRCDFVLTRDGRALVEDQPPTLFADADAVPDDEAGWLEVKVVAQHRPLGANRGYAARLASPVWADVEKLARDPGIRDGAVLLLLFTEDDAIADHDLDAWARRATLRGLHLWPRREQTIDIGDRLGNRRCRIAIFPLERPMD